MCMFVAWTMARWPDSQFLYISYSQTLSAKHTAFIKRIFECRAYQDLFGITLRQDSKAKDFFSTVQGGAVRAFGSGSSVTGMDAGLPGLNRFSGAVICFPYHECVHTEFGILPIGIIVEKKLPIRVWSRNLQTGIDELQPIQGWYENKGSDIIEVILSDDARVQCTPDHLIWTENRGWVEAQHLSSDDTLSTPIHDRRIMHTNGFRHFHTTQRQIFHHVQRLFRKIFEFSQVPLGPYAFSNGLPGITTPDVLNTPRTHSVLVRHHLSRHTLATLMANVPYLFRRQPTPTFRLHRLAPLARLPISRFRFIRQCGRHLHRYLRLRKDFQNQLRNRAPDDPRILTQRHQARTRGFYDRRIQPAKFRLPISQWPTLHHQASLLAYAAKIGNRINTLIIGNRSPYFIHKIGHAPKTYCLNVANYHNFYAGTQKGILVANCDDLTKPDESHSTNIRETILRNYQETILQRLRGPNVPIICIAQRLHEDDICAYMLSGKDEREWDSVILKALDDAGNPLYPEVNPLEQLLEKKEKSPYVFASQYQQDPIPAGGALFQRENFPLLWEDPQILVTFITADTAETAHNYNDASAFSFFGVYLLPDKTTLALHWIDAVEIFVEPKDLKEAFMAFYYDCQRYKVPPSFCAIEKKSTGVTLVSILKSLQGMNIREIDRNRASGSKTARFLQMQPYIASKLISFTQGMFHVEPCIKHMMGITANDSHRRDDLCFVANTKIATQFGYKNIQDIRVGDKVITPFGLGRVSACGLSGVHETIKRFGLEATPAHPFYTSRGFARCDTLNDDTTLSYMSFREIFIWKYRKLLSLMELSTGSWGREGIILASNQKIKEKVLKDFMSLFGSFIAEGQLKKGMWFIIKMVTVLTTTTTILSVFHMSNIWNYIKRKNPFGLMTKRIFNYYKKFDRSLWLGTKVRKVALGIQKMLKSVRQKFFMIVPEHVLSAAENSSIEIQQDLDFVMKLVSQDTIEKTLVTSQLTVFSVENPLQQKNGILNQEIEKLAPNRAQRNCHKKPVYNLTVETYGVYYANDILVSNCDTLSDSIRIALIDKSVYVPKTQETNAVVHHMADRFRQKMQVLNKAHKKPY